MYRSLTPSEIAFADSTEGRAAIAHKKMAHDMQHGAEPWTDRIEAGVIRDLAAADARQRVHQTADAATYGTQADTARAEADTARAQMMADMAAGRK